MSESEIRNIVRRALSEDLGESGDITTAATVPKDARASAKIVARQQGFLAGLEVAQEVFCQVDSDIRFAKETEDGERLQNGQKLVSVAGPAAGILTAERTALNFIGHLSGIATATHKLVEAVQGTKAKILDTRKTTPGLRKLEKYAVRMGGGYNHRIGLFDAVLIKDNHLVASRGIKPAIENVRQRYGDKATVEVEVETLDQLAEAIETGADRVLLDNMDLSTLRKAVQLANGKVQTEASGGITLEDVRAVAETGVDFISVGWITHSAPNLDVALEFEP